MIEHEKPNRPKHLRITVVIIVLLLAGLGTAAGLIVRARAARMRAVQARPVFTVPEPGPLTIRIRESGTVRPRDQIVITSEVQGRPTILTLIPEGTLVEKGDLLLELDASQLEENLLDQTIRLQNNEAAFVRARETLEVVRNQARADVLQAELNLRFALEDMTMYREGEHPKQVKEMEARIALAAEELQRAQQAVEGSRVLFEERFISQNEMQADELAARKAELNLDLAHSDLDLFRQHTHQRRLDELEAAIEQTTLALDRVKRRTAADIIQAEAELSAREAELEQQRGRRERIVEQIGKTRITAPRGGLVVYATSTQVSWRGQSDPLAEGQEVRERQHLIYLPTTDAMIAAIKIPESRLQVVSSGMPAAIRVDALPGREFTGRVTRIAPLPDATSVWMNPDLKVYNTDILLDDSDPALRTGMSCTVEIEAAHYEEAIAVPIHAVIRRGRQPVVFVREGAAFNPRAVEIGLDDNRLIHVTAGLVPGEHVLLDPPLEDSDSERRERTPADEPASEAVPAVPAEPTPATGRRGEGGGRPGGTRP